MNTKVGKRMNSTHEAQTTFGPRLNRRMILAGTAALAATPGFVHAETIPRLVARPATARLRPAEYPETPIWGYDGGVPGPLLRLKQGERLMRTLVNELPQPTSVHWHGVRVPNPMDGVPGITQEAVAPGGQFDYDFTPPDAGTFWYHSHNQSTEQTARELYGLLIVDEIEPPEVDHDISVVLDDWRLRESGEIIEDVTADEGDQALIAIHEDDEAFILADIKVSAGSGSLARGAINPLPSNPLVPLEATQATTEARLIMESGAMGGLPQGIWKGERLSIQQLVEQGQVLTFNDVAGLPEAPLIEVAVGDIVEIPMQNDTELPHAMHQHGHHFQERLADSSLGPLRDTLLMDRGETRSIVFQADNPGDWPLHCHMLSHQKAGMKTWMRVAA